MQKGAITMDLQEKAFAFARHLHDENIIKIDDLNQINYPGASTQVL